jgi:PAS domain S-box-containing protein
MAIPLSVLILEDYMDDVELILYRLRRAGFQPNWQHVETKADYVAHLNPDLDVILADYNLPHFNALEALDLLQERDLHVPLIIVTGAISEQEAIECMRRGAADYLFKDRLARLGAAVARTLQEKKLRDEKQQAEVALKHRNTLLQTAAQVSKSASTILDLKALRDQAVNLIRERFNFYYVGIFLVDAAGEYAVLRAGTGEAGRQMLEAGHRLAVGGESMVGWCVAHAQARISLDVGQEAVRFDNPVLPQTRSEMALPLMSQRKCIGALTVQSNREAAFSEQDVAVLQTMADQLAITMENARLFQQLDTQLEQLRQLNTEITHLQHLLQNITDSLPSALITLDPQGRVLTWNPVAEALTGQAAPQMQGQSLWQTCPTLGRYRDLFEQVLREGQVRHRRKELVATKARMTYRDVSVFPLIANAIQGVGLRIDDVTQQMQLEEMMLQSAKMASVGGLAAGVAHEINNPLGAMMQSAQVLQVAFDTKRPRTRERLQACGVDPAGLERYLQARNVPEYLSGIRSAGERAAKIVSDLLSFSRKSTSRIAPRDLNRLVEQTLDLAAADYDLKKQYDFRDIETVCELAPDLPQVACDGQQIQQVVLNLVRNAAQAMAGEMGKRDRNREARPRLTLRTSLAPSSSPLALTEGETAFVRLEVEDNGPGMPEAVRERLFEPFFTTKEIGKGTGLGLWLCWSIVVERHKGQIWVEPGEREGARFVIELPAA